MSLKEDNDESYDPSRMRNLGYPSMIKIEQETHQTLIGYKSIDFVGDRPSLIKTKFDFINITEKKDTTEAVKSDNIEARGKEEVKEGPIQIDHNQGISFMPNDDMINALANYISNMMPSVEVQPPISLEQQATYNDNKTSPKEVNNIPRPAPRIQGSINPNLVKRKEEIMACSGVFGTEACFKSPESEKHDSDQKASAIGFVNPARNDRELKDALKQTEEHRMLIRQLYSKELVVDKLKEEVNHVENRLKGAQETNRTIKKDVGVQDEEQIKLARQVRDNETEVSKLKLKLDEMVLKASKASESLNQSLKDSYQSADNPQLTDGAQPKTQETRKQETCKKYEGDHIHKTKGKSAPALNDDFSSHGSLQNDYHLGQSSASESLSVNYDELTKDQLKIRLAYLRKQKTDIAKKFKELISASKNEREQLLNRLTQISDLSHQFCTKLGETVDDPKLNK